MVAVSCVLPAFRILVLAGDITPLDIMSHLPLLAEEASIPYVFVASKEELGHASSTKRPTSCVMLCPDAKVRRKPKDGEDSKEDVAEFKASYAKCFSEIKELVRCMACNTILSLADLHG